MSSSGSASVGSGIYYLLGDPRRPEPFSVASWIATVDKTRKSSRESDSHQGRFTYFDLWFELACASFYDSRLLRAIDAFQIIITSEPKPSPRRALARMGVGRSNSALRRYPLAARSLSKALEDSRACKSKVLEHLSELLLLVNASDWGRGAQAVNEIAAFDDCEEPLAALLETYRAFAVSRDQVRTARREDAIASVERWYHDPRFATVAAIPRGMLIRWYGILQAQKGSSGMARKLLEDSIAIFRAAGHDLGEIQSVLSLARVHAPLDHKQTMGYLSRATLLLDRVEPISSENSDGRHMPAEKAQLNSRLGDLEFTQGNFAEALRYYKLDLAGIWETASEPGERVPRSVAYVHRNIGRSLAALKRWNEAVEHLQDSVKLFQSVNDQMNVLFSQVLLCDAYIESRKFREAGVLVAAVEQLVGLTPNREKEKAIVHILKALLLWREESDFEMALGILREAKEILRKEEPGYYQVRALMVEAEVLTSCQDELTAAKRLREARRHASNLDLEDLRIQIESLMERIDKRYLIEPNDEVMGKVDLSVLFADIRGFTRACQIVDPVVMGEFIADFAEMISRQVSLCSGRPIRFLGDCVMAVFGMNKTEAQKEVLSVKAASLIWERFARLRHHWGERCVELQGIGIGFGVSTGEVIVGRFGNKELSEYSAIGEAVNLASRMQGNSEDGEILVCGRTWRTIERSYRWAKVQPRALDLKGIGKVDAIQLKAADTLIELGKGKKVAVASAAVGAGGDGAAGGGAGGTGQGSGGGAAKKTRARADKRGPGQPQVADDVAPAWSAAAAPAASVPGSRSDGGGSR